MIETMRPLPDSESEPEDLGGPLRPFVGQSPRIRQIFRLIHRIGRSRSPVLLTGETGTGKEVLARAIHSVNPIGPFVAIDCSALVSSLVETELFGHAKGAFTGANSAKAGLIEIAHGGTAFFDEIGELPLESQAKLLRVLQESEFRPVGSLRMRKVDLRVIAATNRDLVKEVETGRFRRDLFYRLNVVYLRVPPLRERKEDIPAFIDYFLAQYGSQRTLTPELIEAMLSYDWPGNVRELQNCIRCMIEINSCPLLETGDLHCALQDHLMAQKAARLARGAAPAREQAAAADPAPLFSILESEKRTIVTALEHTGGDRVRAARLLGVAKSTFYRKLRKHHLME